MFQTWIVCMDTAILSVAGLRNKSLAKCSNFVKEQARHGTIVQIFNAKWELQNPVKQDRVGWKQANTTS